jgi:hypothetical protein
VPRFVLAIAAVPIVVDEGAWQAPQQTAFVVKDNADLLERRIPTCLIKFVADIKRGQ